MKIFGGRILARLSLATGLLLCASAAASAEPGSPQKTKAVMHELVGAIRTLLPLSADSEAFRAKENAPKITAALKKLSTHAGVLGSHGASDAPEFTFLGTSLAGEAREALRRYERGQHESAAFLLQDITEYCVTCHARLPSPDAAKVATRLIDDKTLAKLRPDDRARILVATRQFDAARQVYESLLLDEKAHATELVAPLVDYLTMSVRVRHDIKGPQQTLARFAERKDLWLNLRADLEQWMTSLKVLEPHFEDPPSLGAARKIVDEGKTLNRFPADRRALVHNIVASSILHRVVQGRKVELGDETAAEAYFLLGLTEASIRESYWVSDAEFYLETAIRIAPGGKFAEEAYAVLEQETVLAYAGTSGIYIPADVSARLDELRALINRATEAKAADKKKPLPKPKQTPTKKPGPKGR